MLLDFCEKSEIVMNCEVGRKAILMKLIMAAAEITLFKVSL